MLADAEAKGPFNTRVWDLCIFFACACDAMRLKGDNRSMFSDSADVSEAMGQQVSHQDPMVKVGPVQGTRHVLVQLHVGLHVVMLKDELNHLHAN